MQARGRAYRRHHRQRLEDKARRIFNSWGYEDEDWKINWICRWADNLRKCSCYMCEHEKYSRATQVQENSKALIDGFQDYLDEYT